MLSSFRSIILPFIIFTTVWGSTWIVIRGQVSDVPAQWSVTYRFIIAAAAMALLARIKGESLRLDARGIVAASLLGFTQFCLNFNGVYLAERHITSGVVATVFALLLIPSSLLAWAFLGQRPSPRFALGSVLSVTGVVLLFLHEIHVRATDRASVFSGIGLTLIGMVGASVANVLQARPEVRRYPLFSMLAWSMGAGAVLDAAIAFATAGSPVGDVHPAYWAGVLYLSLIGSVLTFSLYYPVVRLIGPAKASYSSVLVPIIAMSFSTWLENYSWTATSIGGALLALGGMVTALTRGRQRVAVPDAS